MYNKETFLESIEEIIERNKRKLRRFSAIIKLGNILVIILSASIPIVISITESIEDVHLLLGVSIISAVSTIIQGSLSFLGYQDKINSITSFLLKLENERLLYLSETSPYDSDDDNNYHLFIKNTSNFLADDND